MKNDPVVSIIIPTKNEQINIVRCLKSVKDQKYQGGIEVIIVDNFSEDRTQEFVKLSGSKLIISGPERSAQRNIGAKAAQGEWLLFLDADMQLSKGVISECVYTVNQASNTSMISIPEKSVGVNFWGKALALERSCYMNANWLIAARFFSKETFLKYKGFDNNLPAGEDWDLTQRLLKKGVRLLTTQHSYIKHHEPNTSLLNMLKKELYYIKYIPLYKIKHPKAFSYQEGICYRLTLWLTHWRTLIKHPLLCIGFLTYKLTVWIMWQLYQLFKLS